MENNGWEITADRFVLFFDILGFKDMVQTHSHEYVLEKLKIIKDRISKLDNAHKHEDAKTFHIMEQQTKCATFSDSIIFFFKR